MFPSLAEGGTNVWKSLEGLRVTPMSVV